MMRLQATKPAASSGAHPVVSTQSLRPMSLLEASLGSVPAAAARKAVKTWAARRQTRVTKNHDKTCRNSLGRAASMIGLRPNRAHG